jgi:hypothetical protein
MSFTPVIVRKDGADRVARSAIELVQFEHDGYTVAREASNRVIEAVAGPDAVEQKKADKAEQSPPAPAK